MGFFVCFAATSRAEPRQVKDTLLCSDVVTICKAHKPIVGRQIRRAGLGEEVDPQAPKALAVNQEQEANGINMYLSVFTVRWVSEDRDL